MAIAVPLLWILEAPDGAALSASSHGRGGAGIALRLEVFGAEAAVLHEGDERFIGWTREAVFVIPEGS